MYKSASSAVLRPDQSYVRDNIKIKQVKADKKMELRKETVKNFTAAVLLGIALILFIKVYSDYSAWLIDWKIVYINDFMTEMPNI